MIGVQVPTDLHVVTRQYGSPTGHQNWFQEEVSDQSLIDPRLQQGSCQKWMLHPPLAWDYAGTMLTKYFSQGSSRIPSRSVSRPLAKIVTAY